MPDFTGSPLRPRWVYNDGAPVDYPMSISQRPYDMSSRGFGGSDVSAAGVPAAFEIRRDNLLRLTLRFPEHEWDDVERVVRHLQLAGSATFYPDQDDTSIAYTVYGESPAMGSEIRPRRSDFPRVLELDVTVRRTTDAIFDDPFYSDALLYWLAGTDVTGSVFARASVATYIDVDAVLRTAASGVRRTTFLGAIGSRVPHLLLEAARTNLATRSEQLDHAAWTKNNSTISADATTAPDGLTTADKIVEAATTATHTVSQQKTGLTSAVPHTASVYAEAAERTWLFMTEGDNVTASAWFDLVNGVVGTVQGTGSPSARMEQIGTTGRYRCELTYTPLGTVANVQFGAASADGTANYLGDATKGLFAWGAQFEEGSFASSYINSSADPHNLKDAGYLELPGTSGDYASAPDSAALSVTGDIDIQMRVSLDDWTPAGKNTFVSKWVTGGNQRSYWFKITTEGKPELQWSTTGSSSVRTATSTAAVSATDGDIEWVRVKLDVDTGDGNLSITFYTGGSGITPTWVQLGSAILQGGTSSIFDGTALLEVGSALGSVEMLAGKVYRVRIYEDLTETSEVFDADFSDVSTHNPDHGSIVENANSAVVTVFTTTAAAAATRVVESISRAFPAARVAMTGLCTFIEKGTAQLSTSERVFHIGSSTVGADSRLTIYVSGGNYRLEHDDNATVVTSTMAAAPAQDDLVELRWVLFDDGAVQLHQTLNSGSEVSASKSAATTLTGNWADSLFWLNSAGTGNVGFNAYRSVKVVPGAPTLAQMRAL